MSETFIPPPPRTRPVLPKAGLGRRPDSNRRRVDDRQRHFRPAISDGRQRRSRPAPDRMGGHRCRHADAGLCFPTLASRKPDVDGTSTVMPARVSVTTSASHRPSANGCRPGWATWRTWYCCSRRWATSPRLRGRRDVPAIIGASIVLWIVHGMTLRGVKTAAFVNVVVSYGRQCMNFTRGLPVAAINSELTWKGRSRSMRSPRDRPAQHRRRRSSRGSTPTRHGRSSRQAGVHGGRVNG